MRKLVLFFVLVFSPVIMAQARRPPSFRIGKLIDWLIGCLNFINFKCAVQTNYYCLIYKSVSDSKEWEKIDQVPNHLYKLYVTMLSLYFYTKRIRFSRSCHLINKDKINLKIGLYIKQQSVLAWCIFFSTLICFVAYVFLESILKHRKHC